MPSATQSGASDLYALVLASQGIPYLQGDNPEQALYVPDSRLEQALRELRAFVQEEQHWQYGLSLVQARVRGRFEPTLWVFFALALFYLLTSKTGGIGLDGPSWKEVGTAKEWLILRGQWWRAGTALTLHANSAHLLGNLGLGLFFVGLLCREFGSGWGWLLVLTSGTLANIANAWTSPVGHDALGASTAIFAAVGVIGGLRALQGRPGRVFLDSILPLGAGLGILAMLGTSGANTDIGGHFWGFGLGLAWGSLFGAFLRLGWSPTPSSNRLAGLLALGLICSCWGLALGNHL